MINSVYCRACREPLDLADTFCKKCGTDQRQIVQQPTQIMPRAISGPGPVASQTNGSSTKVWIALAVVFALTVGSFMGCRALAGTGTSSRNRSIFSPTRK